ncbi:hypothetical protein B6U66_00960 [Candidatus Bathyarchaeota archaeon ex4484_135]|nr:MAG: hypothetical protein B6U66_00960 [Candidatus Bathyarchaeota archaeon ex4484_135]
MTSLAKLGFSDRTFSEVVLALEIDGRVHVQPLGVRLSGDLLWARVFRSTRLHGLLRTGLKGSLNITYDPRAFLEPVLYGRLTSLEVLEGPKGPYLPSSSASIFVEVCRVEERGDFSLAWLKPTGLVMRGPPRAFNRAFSALIEALIHLSRARYYAIEGNAREASELAEKGRSSLEPLRHATEDPSWLEMASEVLAELELWSSWAREKAKLPERGFYTLVMRSRWPEEGFYIYTGSSARTGLIRCVEECLSRGRASGPLGDFTARPGVRFKAIMAAEGPEALRNRLEKVISARVRPRALAGLPEDILYVGEEEPTEGIKGAYRVLGLEPFTILFP